MKHLGDITKINGTTAPAVDIITGGSPCQDLSIAGNRAGLAGERSGLFMEQIRIIKEMREHDRADGRTDVDIRPRYMVWENVPGAFSSNNGEDFRVVLEETARIVQSDAFIPRPANGRWTPAGCIMGDGWSIAWRVHDAQYWGVPQRRKRISLVADFGGDTAPEVLFEREGLPRDSEQSGETRQATPRDAENGTREAISFQERAGKPGGGKRILIQNEHVGALSTVNNQNVVCIGNGQVDQLKESDKVGALNCMHDQQAIITASHGGFMTNAEVGEIAHTIQATDYKDPQVVAYGLDQEKDTTQRVIGSLQARDYKGIGNQYVNEGKCIIKEDEKKTIIRRLTPLECERLQGYPDGWTDIGDWIDSKGKKHKGNSDAPRYKALGNSIALPFWEWMARRMAEFLPEGATMASLFDGIGGFPLVFSRAGITPVWASEIEEFPIAVTKIRFPEREEDKT